MAKLYKKEEVMNVFTELNHFFEIQAKMAFVFGDDKVEPSCTKDKMISALAALDLAKRNIEKLETISI